MHAKTSIIVASLLALAGATSATPSPNAQGFVKVARNGMERRQAIDAPPEVNGSASQVSGDAGCTQRRPSWVHGGKYGVRTHGRHHNLTGEHRHHSNKTSAAEDEPVFTLPVESSESSTAQVEPTETSSASSSASTTSSSTTSSSVIEDAIPTPSPSSQSESDEAAPAPTSEVVQDNAAPNGFSKEILDAHNAARSTHSAPAMTWSDELTALAKTWGDMCVWEHGGADGAGQNLAAGTGSQSAQSSVDMWMDEEKDYNPANPNYSHFTQVVWKASTELGCYQSKCSKLVDGTGNEVFPGFGDSVFTVCNYSPAGNVIGQFADNVTKN